MAAGSPTSERPGTLVRFSSGLGTSIFTGSLLKADAQHPACRLVPKIRLVGVSWYFECDKGRSSVPNCMPEY